MLDKEEMRALMSGTTFKTNPIGLEDLLQNCGSGKIKLPDFQRSWVWDEDRIKSLISSVSQAFPVGALMALDLKSGLEANDRFASRPVQGAKENAVAARPDQLLLDGQQRMTSLYQTCMRNEVVETITPRRKLVRRWFYIDIAKALDQDAEREEAIVSVPEDRKIKSNFDRDIDLDLSTSEFEYKNMFFPINCVFNWDEWQDGFTDYWIAEGQAEKRKIFTQFKNQVLQNFKSYQVPVIALGPDTSHAAVCLVFEKVNTGGKPLDAFELVTAMYAAQGFRLRDDWLGIDGNPGVHARLQTYGRAAQQKFGILEKIASTDFLQAIALLHTLDVRASAEDAGKRGSELPAVRATRQSLLSLPLDAYKQYRESVEEGFFRVAQFLRQQNIYRAIDLPYLSQLVPFAAILVRLGNKWENASVREKMARWYWCGIFGELYGSAAESRFARDVVEVPAWIDGGSNPSTITDGIFRTGRLESMRTRQSAAYKGVHALLMGEGAKDFRTGQSFDQTVFFDESVDIHHIFPQDWCKKQGISVNKFDTIANKTPLGYRTNRILSGAAPSKYLAKLETGTKESDPIHSSKLDQFLETHAINPELLRNDQFEEFMANRSQRLLQLISRATGHPLAQMQGGEDEGDDVPDDESDVVFSADDHAEAA